MKIRQGFVSNSSSSSFVVIKNTGKFHNIIENELYCKSGILVVDGSLGNLEFGWRNIIYDGFWDKLHFAYIQACYLNSDRMNYDCYNKKPPFDQPSDSGLKMLEEVLKEELGVREIEWKIQVEDWDNDFGPFGYIDHQSTIYEGRNWEIFESKESLKSFLFDDESYIQGGNDNDPYDLE